MSTGTQERPEPRLSVNKLGEYLSATPIRRGKAAGRDDIEKMLKSQAAETNAKYFGVLKSLK